MLKIKFNASIAREIMHEKNSTITLLLYQLYIALTNKEKRNLIGIAIKTMQSTTSIKYEHLKTEIYQKVSKILSVIILSFKIK